MTRRSFRLWFHERGCLDVHLTFALSWAAVPRVRIKTEIENRNITAITFNEDGQVTDVAEYGIEDGRYINYVDRKTPTRGRELSVLEQIFGTIGRLPTDQIGGQQNIPGGGGGPR